MPRHFRRGTFYRPASELTGSVVATHPVIRQTIPASEKALGSELRQVTALDLVSCQAMDPAPDPALDWAQATDSDSVMATV